MQGTYFKSVKHPGFLASGNGSMTDERNARCAAVKSAWFSFQKYWYTASPPRIKIIVFRCLVYESAVSGWTAAAPTNADTRTLDSVVLHYARKLLTERATQETTRPDGTTAIRRITGKTVWRLIRCVLIAIELTVRRLK